MRARDHTGILYLTSVLASYVIYLCVSVSKPLPFLLVTVLVASLSPCTVQVCQTFAGIKQYLQKRE